MKKNFCPNKSCKHLHKSNNIIHNSTNNKLIIVRKFKFNFREVRSKDEAFNERSYSLNYRNSEGNNTGTRK